MVSQSHWLFWCSCFRLGKTIQVIAFLSGMFDAGKVKTVLIVSPVAVLVNWSKELEKWLVFAKF